MELDEAATGLYVAAFFDDDTNRLLAQYIRGNNIPNPVATSSLHSTIVYSKAPVVGFEPNHTVEVPVNTDYARIECWDTNSGRTLVLCFFSPYMHFRFQEARACGATFDYDEYTPHVTLSYDIGDLDHTVLPRITFPLVIAGEYGEPLEDSD